MDQHPPTYHGTPPSLDLLSRYLQDRVSEAEKADLDRQLQEDPFLADALEGMRQSQPDTAQQAVQRLTLYTQRQLNRHAKRREAMVRRRFRAIPKDFTQITLSLAAGLALLLGITWVLRQNSQRVQAEPQAITSIESSPRQQDMGLPDTQAITSREVLTHTPDARAPQAAPGAMSGAPMATAAPAPATSPEDITPQMPSPVLTPPADELLAMSSEDDDIEADYHADNEQIRVQEEVSAKTTSAQPRSKPAQSSVYDAPPVSDSLVRQGQILKAQAMGDLIAAADQLYREGNYARAMDKYLEVQTAVTEHVYANFQIGLILARHQAKCREGIPYLERAEVAPSPWQDAARWELHLCALNQGKLRDARRWATLLADHSNAYQQQAAQYLRENP